MKYVIYRAYIVLSFSHAATRLLVRYCNGIPASLFWLFLHFD